MIRKSDIHGKGSFADCYIPIGYILSCDVLETDDRSLLSEYIFHYSGRRMCIHIGWASFLNSSDNPNLKHLKIDTTNNLSYFEVIRDINLGDELTLKYL